VLSTRREGYLQCRLSCSMARTVTSCWQRGSGGGRGEPATAAAGSNQSSIRIQTHHSRATGTIARASTQGSEAVLSSLAPLCSSSDQDRHKLLAAWLRGKG
jgi:hypothetical protein